MDIAHSDLKLDWLSFTYNPLNFETAPDYDVTKTFFYFMDKFPEFKKVPDMIFLDHYWSHYSKVVQFNMDIMVHYDDSDHNSQNKGVCVQVSSRALPYLFDLFHVSSVRELLTILKSRGANFSRIDLAFDDFTKSFLPHDFWKFYESGCFVTRIKYLHWIRSGTKQWPSQTFYVGNRSSSKCLRIYDKEVESRGEIKAVRYEFELKKFMAANVAQIIIDGDQLDFISLINEFFRIVNPDSATRTNNMDLLDEWQSFCNNLKFNEVSPMERKIDKKLADKWRWFQNTVAPSLSIEFNRDPDRVFNMLLTTFHNLDPKRIKKYLTDIEISESIYFNPYSDF